MCNFVTIDPGAKPEPIPAKGKGRKLFVKAPEEGETKLIPAFQIGYYESGENGWVEWKKDNPGDGFCFFLDENEIPLFYKGSHGSMLELEIEYEGGIQSRLEPGMAYTPPRIALCKRFRLVDPQYSFATGEK